jgi:hypothetical protein
MAEKKLVAIKLNHLNLLCGSEMSMTNAVARGSIAFGGIGFQNLLAESNIQKIESLVCHINRQSILGKIMVTNFKRVQLHSGSSTPFLEKITELIVYKETSS